MSDAKYKDKETLQRLYYEEGLSGRQIAEKLDCSQSTVFRWMEKFGIDRQDKIQAIKEHKRKEYANYRMSEDGHYMWIAAYNGKNEKMYVARLLAIAEYGINAVVDKNVHHKNGIPWDNRSENIELLNRGEHTSHHSQGEDHPNSILTEREVREIKEIYEETDKTQKEVGDEYDISHKTVSDIVNGRRWGHIFE